ncbi:hypothetical protein [uncultured Methylobacterium sp.]|uniref:hypothetical protein n=1 Tax=uncultured Methylobacterium sp. TaxID=157278 RepID=UPI00259351BD|nr:hypothetical protein [uncultured Methylobacterium sp.]
MNIPARIFTIDWMQVPFTKHAGETGHTLFRTLNFGDLRIRMVAYTFGYAADDGTLANEVVAMEVSSNRGQRPLQAMWFESGSSVARQARRRRTVAAALAAALVEVPAG